MADFITIKVSPRTWARRLYDYGWWPGLILLWAAVHLFPITWVMNFNVKEKERADGQP